MRNYFYSIAFVLLILSCGKSDKEAGSQEKNKEYFSRLQDFMVKETAFNTGGGDFLLFVIRRYDCSCNDKNLVYDKEVLRTADKSYKRAIIFIGEKDSDYTRKLNLKDEWVYNDTTKLLEKHGNLFVADKLFVITKGQFSAMFDMEVDNRKRIDEFLRGINHR